MTTLGEVRGTLLESSRDGVIGKYEQEGFQVYAPIEVHDRCRRDQDEPALEREGGGARDPVVAVQQALFKKLESVVQCIKYYIYYKIHMIGRCCTRQLCSWSSD